MYKNLHLNTFFNFLAYSNIFVSLAAMAMAAFTIQAMDFQIDFLILFTIFFITLFSYNFQRKFNLILHKNITPSQQNTWIKRFPKLHNSILIFSFVACIFLLFHLPKESYFLLIPLALISLLYVLKIGSWPALRNIPFLKVFIVAFVWAGVIVLLPALCKSHSFNLIFTLKKQALSLSIALFVFGQSLPFDIRDMKNDQKDKLKTIPHQFGVIKTLRICWMSLGTASIICIISYGIGFISLKESLSLILALASTSLILLYYKKPRRSLDYAILLEACLMLPLIYYQFIFWIFH